MTARFSRLPVLQYCGQAQRLGELGAGSRASAIGTAFHAKCSGSPEALALYARLTTDEKADVDKLIPPVSTAVNGIELNYTDMEQEVAVKFMAGDEVLVQGTADMACHRERIAYVCDIKRSSFTVPDGPASLQVIGYAVSYAQANDCLGYVPGIYDATAGEWIWGEYVDLYSEQHEDNVGLIEAAARNDGGEYNVGTHCSQCYARTQCPQFLMPPDVAFTTLEPFSAPGLVNHDNAAELMVLCQRAIDTAEAVKGYIKEFVRENGPIRHNGKIWKGVPTKGKASLDRVALEKDHPDLCQSYTKFGNPYDTFRWVNDPDIVKPKKPRKAKGEAAETADNGDDLL